MRVNYLGPCLLADHPAATELERCREPSCYLVEVSAEAGVEGEVIEGDVLVVDEARPVQHGDLVVAADDGELRLFTSHRIGGGMRLVPASGGQGHRATLERCRGVVVRQAQMTAT